MNGSNSRVNISEIAQLRFRVDVEMRKQFSRFCCLILLCRFGLVAVSGQNHSPQSTQTRHLIPLLVISVLNGRSRRLASTLKGVLVCWVDLCEPQQAGELELSGEILQIESNLNELQIDQKVFEDYFEKIMENDPFNCGICRLEISLCGNEPESPDELRVCRLNCPMRK